MGIKENLYKTVSFDYLNYEGYATSFYTSIHIIYIFYKYIFIRYNHNLSVFVKVGIIRSNMWKQKSFENITKKQTRKVFL